LARPKKDKEMEVTEKLDVRALVNKLNKELEGNCSIKLGAEIPNPFKDRISTGSIGLDCVIGGGIPRGGVTQIIGKESSSKTTLAFSIAREVQKRFKENAVITYAGIEMALDVDRARAVGMEINDRVINVTAKNAEAYLTSLKTIIKSNSSQLIIVDSINGLNTYAEQETAFGESIPATRARIVAKFVRECVWGSQIRDDGQPNNTSIVIINQFSSKIGGFSPTGEPVEQGGGNALKYAKLLDIQLRSGAPLKENKDSPPYAKEINYKILKGKAGCHEGGTGMFILMQEDYNGLKKGQIDIGNEYKTIASTYGVVSRAGAYVKYNEQNYPMDEFERLVREDDEFRSALRAKILLAAKVESYDE
jgi:recombination protein RecA